MQKLLYKITVAQADEITKHVNKVSLLLPHVWTQGKMC